MADMRKLADAIMRDVVDMTDGARGDWIVRVDGEEHSVGVNEDGPYVDVATAEESEEGIERIVTFRLVPLREVIGPDDGELESEG